MIRVKLEYTSGTTEEKQFSNNLEMFDYIKTNGYSIQTMEVDDEGSNNNRPAFWCEKR
jgi:hypothetical protein